MTHRSMQEIHIDSLALAAGVTPPAHMAVSHPRWVSKPSKKRTNRLFSWAINHFSVLCRQTASCVEQEKLTQETAS